MGAALLLSLLSCTKQIIMVADGEPTAHVDDRGQPHFAYPPARETMEKTLEQVMQATR